MTNLDVMSICENEDRSDGVAGFAVSADDMYPLMIEHMRAAIVDEDPENPAPSHIRQYLSVARRFTDDHYALVDGETDPDLLDATDRAKRAEVLETARKWFTAELKHTTQDEMIAVHITKGTQDWRL